MNIEMERQAFEAWAKTQGDKWLIVGGLQWSAGTDDYASARTNAAWAAWQERAARAAQPAEAEVVRDYLTEFAEGEVEALRKAAEPLEPVHGDQLPPIGSKVLIHLASCDGWIEHTVAGYYAWGDLEGDENLHRVFVRVRDSAGYLNARLLKDVRPVDAAMAAKEA